jgi:uncharacterized protein (TIGR00290 family)
MMDNRKDAFCSWSGGKESALALFRAQRSGFAISRLINMVTEDGTHSRTHGLGADLLSLQARALGIPLTQRRTTWNGYEEEFKRVLSLLHAEGILRGVFGDIDMEEHRAWVERVCTDCDVRPSLPLWLEKRGDILSEFINEGFKAVIVAVDRHYLDERWIGREIDRAFVDDIRALGGDVDICGEKGEYHTFVYDGPIFQRPVPFEKGGIRSTDEYFFLDVRALPLKDGE